MGRGARKVTITPDATNTIRLKITGEVFPPEGREVAARLNAVIAYWNTVMSRNKPPSETDKLTADTGPLQTPVARALGDDPFEDK